MNNKLSNMTKFALSSVVIFLSANAEAISTRVGNVVECRQEDNNGNGLYIKREGCYTTSTGTYGEQQYTRCIFKAYFTAEGGKGNKSVIQSLRENSALPSNVDKFTNIGVDDEGGVSFRGITYQNYPHWTSSSFQFRPLDNNGHFNLYVRSESGASYSTDFKQTNFNYDYNCSYIP